MSGNMAKAAKKKEPDKEGKINICQNRRARHDYAILETLECGLVLVGTEVKSLREGQVKLDEAYAKIDRDELWLVGCEIAEYWAGNRLNHKPKRERKLLVHRSELNKFAAKASEKGFTLVPLQIYFKDGKAKIEIGVAKGKQSHDKRESLKTAEAKREIARAMSRKRG
jgi:SsrA-binding protein